MRIQISTRLKRRSAWVASACLIAGAAAAPAQAASGSEPGVLPVAQETAQAATGTATETAAETAKAAAVCEGQTFARAFEEFGDSNLYTLVQGSLFQGPEEGWELSGGAEVVEATDPGGTEGGALRLPAAAEAVSPPVCVTLLYPSARVWLRNGEGGGSVTVKVSYVNLAKPRAVAQLHPEDEWSPSEPFEVRPELGGASEQPRLVRFVFVGHNGHHGIELFGLYVDPRML